MHAIGFTICGVLYVAGAQTLIKSTKNSAIQCSLLPAPPLSFIVSNSPEQQNDDGDSDSSDLDIEVESDSD